MSEIPPKPKLSRGIKALLWTAGLALAYTVTGSLIVPAVIKSQMIKRLPPLTHRQAAVRQVLFNPFTLALTIRGLSLTESNGDAFAGLDEFHLQFQAMSSLSRRAWVFRDVTITRPFAHVIRLKDGSFNFDNLIETNAQSAAKPVPAAPLPAVIVENLSITNAGLDADDLAEAAPFHDKVDPVNVRLTDFSTISNASAPFTFSALTDADEKFAASGKITVQPLQILGDIHISGLDLKRYGPYAALFTKAELAGGKVDAGADYQLAIGPKGPDATVTNGTMQLTDLRVVSPDSGETVVSIPTLAIHLDEASLGRKMARVSSVKSSGGSLLVRQNKDGAINLLALLPPHAPTPAATAPEPAATPPWTAQVDEIAFENYGIVVEDLKPEHPVKIEVSALTFSVKGFNSATLPPLSTAVSLRLNGQGTFSADGTVALSPFSADLALKLAGLDLPPFTPYMPPNIKLVLSKGQLNVNGRARCALKPDGPAGDFAGDVALKDFAAADPIHYRDLVKFDALTIKGIQAAYPEIKLQIQEIAIAGFSANAIIDTNGQINLLAVLSTNAPGKTTAPAATAGPAPRIDLGALVIDKASFHYVDESIKPNATFDLRDLSGTIKGVSSQPQGPAKVDIRGNVDAFSPFSISGDVDPLAKDISLDLAILFKNVELTSMSPYMEKFGGYPLNKGKLALQLDYNVDKRKLAATNKIVIANLTLGSRNNSTNATHLPIKLGIALLKDREEKIDLDVPLSGSLDDPEFRIAPLIWKVVENLLVKAATSPFSLLGRVLGGGGEELSSADFAPGEATLAPSETAKMQKLAKALYERPALTLQIAGSCAPAADSAVLARRHLRRRINKLRADEQAAAGQPVQSVESINLDQADYARLLQKLYKQNFGASRTVSTPSNPSLSAAKSPPGETPRQASMPPVPKLYPQTSFTKGGEYMMRHETAPRPSSIPVAAKPGAPAKPLPGAAPDLAQMEEELAAQIRVTDDELRELEQARAQTVRSALLESGQIPPERIFILAPQPINAAAQGETRANFSLE